MAGAAKKSGGKAGGLGLWIGLTTAALVIVIIIALYSLITGAGGHDERTGVREAASAESRAGRPSLGSAVRDAVLPRLSAVGGQESCRSDAGVLKTLSPDESMRVRGAGGTIFFFPDPSTEEGSRLISACSLIDPDNCITPETPNPRGNFRVWQVTNESDKPVDVACLWEPRAD